jgi:hypothetical protein
MGLIDLATLHTVTVDAARHTGVTLPSTFRDLPCR